jgi:hypothetical protein
MSEGKKQFFSFPIGLLAIYPDRPTATLSTIIDYAIGHYAERAYGDWDLEALKEQGAVCGLDGIGGRKPVSAGDYRIALAANSLGVNTPGGIKGVAIGIATATNFLAGVSAPARNNMVQLRTRWLWDCWQTIQGEGVERSLSWRELRVLAALLSKVGAKGWAKCGWQEVSARVMGCCGKNDLRTLPDTHRTAREPLALTRSQIRTTIDRLELDHFFACYKHGWSDRKRETWISFSMSRSELRDKVIGTKLRRSEQRQALRDEDTAAVQAKSPSDSQAFANTNRETPEKPPFIANINSSPEIDHPVANPLANVVANPVANVVANINKNNLNKNDSNTNDANIEQLVSSDSRDFSDSEEECRETAEEHPEPPASNAEPERLTEAERQRYAPYWPDYAKTIGAEDFPLEGCWTRHREFRRYCAGRGVSEEESR